MEHDDKTPREASYEDSARQARGPVELDPTDFAKVSGGLPNATWPPATSSAVATLAG